MKQPVPTSACLTVKKVVEGGDASTPFFANINNVQGSSGEQASVPFNPTRYNQSWSENGDDLVVTEINIPANWALTGVKVLDGINQGHADWQRAVAIPFSGRTSLT